MTSHLQKILDTKREELKALRTRKLPSGFKPRPTSLKRSPDQALRLIGEIKFRSPSAGELSKAMSVAQRAQAYEAAGLSMISVLCDGPFFGGSFEDLEAARESCDLPLLCKEFIIDEAQLDAARAFGADWVLLIARCLTPARSLELISAAKDRGLGVLFEIHGQQEAKTGLESGSSCIGVNARDLDTLQMDAVVARQILSDLPAPLTAIHLSGLKTGTDVAALKAGRADAALIGEVLMRQADPSRLLQELVAAARN